MAIKQHEMEIVIQLLEIIRLELISTICFKPHNMKNDRAIPSKIPTASDIRIKKINLIDI